MRLLIIFLLSISSAMANTLTVVIPFAVGTVVDQLCRKVFEQYDYTYNTKSIMLNVPGGDQMIAHRQFIEMNTSRLLCAGNGVGGFNQYFHPEVSPGIGTLKPVVNLLSFTHFIFTPSKNQSLDSIISEAKRTNKKILLGGPSTNAIKIMGYVLHHNNVSYTPVVYKKPGDAIPSLRDGSLDLYIDGGTLKPLLVQTEGVLEISHVGFDNKSASINLAKKHPILLNLVSNTVIYAPATLPNKDILEFNKRLNSVLNNKDMRIFYEERVPYHTPNNGTVQDSIQFMDNTQRIIKNVYN
jgi:tripartite-type tricarboxylate transporter receptor subunit TctC